MMEKNINPLKEDNKTITLPPADFLKFRILQRRDEALDSIQHYEQRKFLTGAMIPTSIVRSKVSTLFRSVMGSMRQSMTPKEFESIKYNVFNNEFENVEKAFNEIDAWLYDKRITRFDNIKFYDSTNPEIENIEKGL